MDEPLTPFQEMLSQPVSPDKVGRQGHPEPVQEAKEADDEVSE